MAKKEEKQEPKYRNMVSDTSSVFEQPLNGSLDPVRDWKRNGKKLEYARYFSYPEACRRKNESPETLFSETSHYDRLRGVVFYMKPGDKEVIHSGLILRADPELKPSKLEEKAEKPEEFSIDKFVGDIDKVEPDIEGDDETFDMASAEPQYKPGTKSQYKPDLIKPLAKPQPAAQHPKPAAVYKPTQEFSKPITKPTSKPQLTKSVSKPKPSKIKSWLRK